MRVGLVIYGSLETRSGGYLYDRKLVARLQARGDDVRIFSLPWRDYPRHLLQNFWRDWATELARAPLDILIQDELNHPSLFLLNHRLKRKASYPIISLVHHLRSDEAHAKLLMPLYRNVERRYLRTVDGFIFNSRATRAAVQALAQERRPSIVAHPGRAAAPARLTPTSIRARATEPGPLRLLFVGAIIPRKGLHVLLQALSLLPADAATLTIVGDDAVDRAYASRMRHLADSAPRVQWLGPVTNAELDASYRSHHALVVPSQHEGFGIVYLEAMGYGLVAVGSQSGGGGEVIRAGESGLLIPPGDPGTLAQRLHRLHRHRAELGEMGVSARQAYLQHPTWEQTANHIRDFLQATVSQSSYP